MNQDRMQVVKDTIALPGEIGPEMQGNRKAEEKNLTKPMLNHKLLSSIRYQ